jgi:short-subunit dehydrogenase/catechol 2,3-dioxygenase-like lactoylglutathione lyase family enzyme
MRLSQVAISALDLRRTQHWYQEVLGLAPAGGTNLFFGPLASMVQGLPRAASTCWWLVDRQEQFQIELFEFRSPLVRPLPPDWRPCDVGYTTISFWVANLDRVIERATEAGTPPLTQPSGPGGARRVCVRDPEGVLIELMEEDPRAPTPRARPRPQIEAVARSVSLTVPDLERSRRFFANVLGMSIADGLVLHDPEHEALWGLDGAKRESLALWADDMVIELVEYADPRGEPWPRDYRISDQGLLNIAFGFRERAEFEAAYRRCEEAGVRANGPPLRLGAWSVVYVNDPQGFSVELLHVEPWYEARMGFGARPTPSVAPLVGRTPARLRQRRRFQTALITGAAGGLGRELCHLAVEDGTRLVVMDRDRDRLALLESELGGRVKVIARDVDFADLEAVDESAAKLEDLELDLMIACAGLDRAQSLLGFDWRQARDDFAVNSLSNLVLLSRLAPGMAARGAGHVTAIASLAGLVGMPYEASYSSSKAALATIVESARSELAPKGITFTAVFPGFVDTPMFRANAFKKPYSIPARDAAERIYMATLRRRETLAFPARQHARVRLARMLPVRLRDRLARDAMEPPTDVESRPG